MRRWILWIAICVFGLILFAVAGIRAVLWTDLPRRYVLQALSRQLGARISVRSFSTGWAGTTILEDIAIGSVAEQDAFFTAREIKVSHTAPALIPLTRSVNVSSIQVQDAALYIRQDKMGRWNIEELASVFGGLDHGGDNWQNKRKLPKLEISNATAVVVGHNGEVKKFSPLNLHGAQGSTLAWHFDVNIPSRLDLQGRIVPGQAGSHVVDFRFERMDDLLEIWFPNNVTPTRASGQWQGQLTKQKLTGRLKLEHLQLGTAKIRGDAGIEIAPDEINLKPEDLVLDDQTLPFEKTTIAGGMIRLQRNMLEAVQLVVATGCLTANVSGHWNRETGKGQWTGSWTRVSGDNGIDHAGTWDCSLEWPRAGPKHIQVKAVASGRSRWGRWDAEMEAAGSGLTASQLMWQTSIPHLSWRHKAKVVQVGGIAARFLVDWPRITLEDLDVPNARQTSARGQFSASDQSWSIRLAAEKLQVKELWAQPLSLQLAAMGDRKSITISDFNLDCNDLTVASVGTITLPETQIKQARASLCYRPKSLCGGPTQAASLNAAWHVDANVGGMVQPLNLTFDSAVTGENMMFWGRMIPTLKVQLHANLTPQRIEFTSSESFDLLGGSCHLAGQYEFSSRSSHLTLDLQEVSLSSVGKMIGPPLIWQGLIAADLKLDLPNFETDRLEAFGSWRAKQITVSAFQAEHGEGEISLRDGQVRLDPIVLRHKTGIAKGKMSFNLSQPQLLHIETTAEKWPIILPQYNLECRADGEAKADLDVLKRSAKANANVSAEVVLAGKDFGYVTFSSGVEGQTLKLREIGVRVFGGSCEGKATIRFDDWPESNAEFKWRDIDLAAPANWWPACKGLAGTSSGFATVRTADTARPLERLLLEIKARTADGSFRGAQIRDSQIVAYAGKDRLVVDQSTFELLGGSVSARATFGRHGREVSTWVDADFRNLDLDQTVRCFKPDAHKIPGRLAGKGTAVTVSHLRGLTGEAEVDICESDLVGSDIIATLHRALGIRFDEPRPSGEGSVKLLIEGSKLLIPSFLYFNRGVEVRGAGTVKDLNLGLESPVDGYAFASNRPLKKMRLPGARELDRLTTSLQKNAASVKVQGTLGEPKSMTVPLPSISAEIRRLLWRQLGK